MSDKKIIIRNCPAFLDDVQLLEFSEGTCNSLQNHRTYCQDCTDCILKQIVASCENKMDTEFNSGSMFAEEILGLLQIEEVE